LSPWLDFYLNQILSGHGRFRPYLKKYGHDTSDGSGIEEDARHVLFECVRFVEDRTVLETATGVSTSPSTLVPTMLRGQVEWDATAKFAAFVMRKLRIAEREKRGLEKHCFAAVPHNFCSLRPFIFLNVYLLVVVIK